MRKIIAALATVTILIIGVVVASALIGRDEPKRATSKNNDVVAVAKNLNTPWSVVFYNGTPLISSRDSGEISELGKDGSARAIGTVADSAHRGEGGLLGLAVDDQQRLYAYYTTESDNRISRFTLSGEPGSFKLGSAETILKDLPSASFHNGGRIAFGPDKQLYATVGDAGNTQSAQDRTQLNGKILRMTPDGKVPADNPFPGSLVYSYGHRNPQGLAWSDNGTMYASEFGQNTWDELNIITAGANYGWPAVEGIEGKDGFVDPVQQWATSDASPSGMAFKNGTLYIANLRGELLRTVPTNNLSSSNELYKEEYGRIRDVVNAPDGSVWFVTNNTDGRGSPSNDDDKILSINR